MQVDFKQFVDALPGLGWAALPDGRAEFLNQRWLEYTGINAEQAAGWGWTVMIHPDDRRRVLEHWQSCLLSGTPVDTEGRMRRHDGTYRRFTFRANPLADDSGNICRWVGANIDIEDRSQGQESLRARESSWHQIVDDIPGLVATMGPKGQVEFLNRQTLEYFGTANEELKTSSLTGVVHPDDLPRVSAARAKAIETGQIYQVEHRCRGADGVYRWFQVRGLPERDAEGTITAWYLLLTDIDDLKRAEEALQSNERALSLMINAIPAYIHVLRADGSVLYANQAVLGYTGLTLDEVQKEDYRTRVSHPEDLERLRDKHREALTRTAPFENEQRVLRKDGTYRWFLVRYNPLLDPQGRVDRWYVAAFDIEDRKRAEAEVEKAYVRLAEAQQLSKTGSFITDRLVDEHSWSQEAFRIFEFDPAARLTMAMIRNAVHPEDLRFFDDVMARGMTGQDVEFDFRILTARGAVKYVRGMARVFEQVAGRPLLVGALQDVTESRLAEEALSRARSELTHVARVTALSALTASIAHEVNQPLAGIIMNASTCLQMLSGNPPNLNGARETARRTLRDGKRASDLVRRLRALFSKKEFKLEPLDLNDTTREVIALTLSDLQRNRVVLRCELADDLPLVTGDRVQLQQVVLNMIRNGCDAMAEVDNRARDLLIKTERSAADQVCLSVIDAGIGFGPEVAEKLFHPFYTTKSDGMGIGLSISRSIIEAHRGRLWATANAQSGATFCFSLPCRSA
jgi:PAS domain S-box-containing protein